MNIDGATEGNVVLINNTDYVGPLGFLPFPINRFYKICIVQVDENGEIKRDPNTGMAVVVNQGEPGHLLGKVQKRREFVGYTDREASKKKLVHNVNEKGDTYFLSGDLLVESDGFYWLVLAFHYSIFQLTFTDKYLIFHIGGMIELEIHLGGREKIFQLLKLKMLLL